MIATPIAPNIETETRGITEAALMAYPEDALIEVVNGEIITMAPVGIEHQIISRNIQIPLDHYVMEHNLGIVLPDGLLCVLDITQPGIEGAQSPDVTFIRQARFSPNVNWKRPFQGAPDLAVEITSPTDDQELLIARVRKYLQFGTEQVWVVYPNPGELHQYVANSDQVRTYRTGAIDAGSMFPGLVLTVEMILGNPFKPSNE